MTKFNYNTFINQVENDLPKIKLRGFNLIKNMIEAEDGALYATDYYYFGLVDKSSFLLDGINFCVKEKNLVVLGILLRVQIDCFALTLVKDPHETALRVLKGESLRNILDKNGNKMTDKYLRDRIAMYDSRLNKVYEVACGYVHFSEKGMLHTLKTNGFPDMSVSIGAKLKEDLPNIKEGYYAFLHFTNLLYEKLLLGWILSKLKKKKENNKVK